MNTRMARAALRLPPLLFPPSLLPAPPAPLRDGKFANADRNLPHDQAALRQAIVTADELDSSCSESDSVGDAEAGILGVFIVIIIIIIIVVIIFGIVIGIIVKWQTLLLFIRLW